MTRTPVIIFVLLCCAAEAAPASMVLPSNMVKGSDSSEAENPAALSIVDDPSADWSLPACLHFDDPNQSAFQTRSVHATIQSDSQASFWITPPDDLVVPGRNLIPQSLPTGEVHATDAIATIPTASVAIPLPSAIDATAAFVPAGLTGWFWKKSRRVM